MGGYLLGADVGTTRAKCLLLSTEGELIASAFRDYPCLRARPETSEQRAEDWWDAFVASAREVLGAIDDPENVLACCLATQGGTLVPVDEAGRPLGNAIVWNDARCREEHELLEREVGARYVYEATGWRLGTGLNALQILWLKRNQPELFSRTWKFLSVPDYMALRLTGRAAIDPSNAGINQLGNLDTLQWDERILRAVGIRAEHLSEIVPSAAVVGNLTEAAARALGLKTSTRLMAGGHDQYCAALGAGAVHGGDVFVATGTCWVVAGISASRPEAHAISRHTVNGLWGSLLSHESGGECLEWYRRELGSTEKISYEALNECVAQAPPGCNGLRFYPFLSGQSAYPEAGEMRGAFVGLLSSHTRQDMGRAIMEGVCCQVAWMMEGFDLGAHPSISMVGGATNSRIWVQMMADITGRAVTVPEVADVGCLGSAMLAGLGAGVYSCPDAALAALRRAERTVPPGPNAPAYRELFTQYKRGYGFLREMYR